MPVAAVILALLLAACEDEPEIECVVHSAVCGLQTDAGVDAGLACHPVTKPCPK